MSTTPQWLIDECRRLAYPDPEGTAGIIWGEAAKIEPDDLATAAEFIDKQIQNPAGDRDQPRTAKP